MTKITKVSFSFTFYETKEALDKESLQLLLKAEEICKSAYAPYSKFCVGAAILLDNGQIVTGNNQENEARFVS